MQIQYVKKVQGQILNCFHNSSTETCFHVILKSTTSNNLITVESSSFTNIDDFILEGPINPICTPCVDNDCFYIATHDGRVLVVDKFSGHLFRCINFNGMFVVSDIAQDADNIYVVCGVPISNGIKVDVEHFTACVADKNTGVNKFKTRLIKGPVRSARVLSDRFYVIGDKIVLSCSNNDLIETNTIVKPDFCPVLIDRFVCAVSKMGTIEIFDRFDLSNYWKTTASMCHAEPVIVDNKVVYFGKHIHTIDIDKQKIETSFNMVSPIVQTASNKHYAFAATESGIILRFDPVNNIIRSTLTESKINKMFCIEDKLIAVSDTQIFSIS